ncbi:MAG: nodulation protein NfeD [candidate division Zixibacteria bacterium]|nr:nodulation protein NfeD [candidate division Zixibacteria bacterium]
MNQLLKTLIILLLFGFFAQLPPIIADTNTVTIDSSEAVEEETPTRDIGKVELLVIDSPIGPVSLRVIENAIEQATENRADALIIQLNTPGGLTESTWDINTMILSSDIPVVMYIAPPGSRAGSAGVYITYACHIAAMAPQTNIGSAHPVGGGGEVDSIMNEKITNDAVAKIKTLATKRGRNIEWAEKAVRESDSITEYEALEMGVIEYIADDLDDLLAKIDGDTVEVISGVVVLNTENADVEEIDIGFANKILEVISNPNIAYILLSIGMMGLYFEFSNPGAIVPGVVGGICLILAFFAMQMLPINYAGLALMGLAIILFILELKVTSHGGLAIGGTISLLLGSLMLIDSEVPYMKISLSVIIPVVAATAGFFTFAIYFALKAQKRKVTTGNKGLVGEIATVKEMNDGQGTVFVHGEYWQALGTDDFPAGTKVKVIGVEGMFLKVDKLS